MDCGDRTITSNENTAFFDKLYEEIGREPVKREDNLATNIYSQNELKEAITNHIKYERLNLSENDSNEENSINMSKWNTRFKQWSEFSKTFSNLLDKSKFVMEKINIVKAIKDRIIEKRKERNEKNREEER